MARYAERTEVPAERSRIELERLLAAHGATGIMVGWDADFGEHRIVTRIGDRLIRLSVQLPDPDSPEFTLTATGRPRTSAQVAEQVAAETRRRWRSLLLVTKARFVAIEDGILTLEQAFLAEVLLPDGRTVSEWLHPQLDVAFAAARMPAMLPAPLGRPELEAGV